jgi:hypothetical protein
MTRSSLLCSPDSVKQSAAAGEQAFLLTCSPGTEHAIGAAADASDLVI